jgi:glutathione S-transferase
MELVAMHYSPWSEKARWALDHHGLTYTFTDYVPMLGELPLRMRAGKWRGKITVPILFDDGRVIDDSYAIARHADRIGARAPLFRGDADDPVSAWNAKSDEALSAGRGIVIANIAADRDAQRESLPRYVPEALRGASVSVAGMGARYLAKKHAVTDADRDACERAIDGVLASLRGGLRGRDYLLDGFSYADVAMAMTLQILAPVDAKYIPLGPATRRCWTVPSLAKKNADLVAWRDNLYARHRGVPGGRAS